MRQTRELFPAGRKYPGKISPPHTFRLIRFGQIPMAKRFSPGEVWRVPLESGGIAILRVVLRVSDLGLSAGGPMAFVDDHFLVQVSRLDELTEDGFQSPHLLLAGLFLQDRTLWPKHGYELIANCPPSLDDIDPPCFFEFRSDSRNRQQVIFCRGEIEHRVPNLTTQEVEGRWGRATLTRGNPTHFGRRMLVRNGRLALKDEMLAYDLRLRPTLDEILQVVAIDIRSRYCDQLPARRRSVYQQALNLR